MNHKRKFIVLEEKLVYQSEWLSISRLSTEADNNKKGTYDVVNRADCVSIIIENKDMGKTKVRKMYADHSVHTAVCYFNADQNLNIVSANFDYGQ